MLKEVIKKIANKAGYEISSNRHRRSLGHGARFLCNRGVSPKTIIDVGVAWGTVELYDEFPSAHLLLVEPNRDWQPKIDDILKKRRGSVEYAAAGSTEDSITLNVWIEHPGSSSIYRENAPPGTFQPRTVPVRSLDSIVAEHRCEGPYLLKVDVQGAELETLKGATETLKLAQAAIIEVTFFGNGQAGEVGEVIQFMTESGFSLYDVLGINYRELDSAVGQSDFVFVPTRGQLRANHNWK